MLLARDFGEICSKSKLLQFWTPPSGHQYVEIRLRGRGGGKRLKVCAKTCFLSKSRCIAGPGFSSKLIQIEASSLLGGLAGAPVWPEFHRTGLLGCCSVPHTQVYAQAVLKVGAPADVSSVGGTPGVWCLNVIGRECWVWVVPCTGSWPGQPPPTKWGKEP